MNTDKIITNIKHSIGALHRQRHPSKGVVVEFDGFHEQVERRTELMRRLRAHQNVMIDMFARKERIARNERRFGYIRRDIADGSPLFAFNLIYRNDDVIGVSFNDGIETIELSLDHHTVDEINERIKSFAKLADSDDAYVVYHAASLMKDNLATVGLRFPQTRKSIDTAQVTSVIFGTSISSTEAGRAVGVNRDDYKAFTDFILAVGRAYVKLPTLMSAASGA